MIKVNLIPPELRKKKKVPFFDKYLIYVVLILGIVTVGLYFVTQQQKNEIQQLNQEIARVEAEIQKYNEQIKLVEQARELKDKINQRISAIQNLDKTRPMWVKTIEEFSNIIPEFLWVSRFSEVEKVVTVKGTSHNLTGVANFIVGLIKSNYFDNIRLTYIREQKIKAMGDVPVYSFELSGDLLFMAAEEFSGKFVSETADETAEEIVKPDKLIAKGRDALGVDKDKAKESLKGLGK